MNINWRMCCLLIVVYGLLSCGGEKNNEGLLPESKMVNIILKTYLAEAKVATSKVSSDSASMLLQTFKGWVLKQEGVSDSVMKANYAYYMARPQELAKIMDIIIDTLSLQEQRLITKSKVDSLQILP